MGIESVKLGPKSKLLERAGVEPAHSGTDPDLARALLSSASVRAAPERAGREGDQPLPTPGGSSVFARLLAAIVPRLHAREQLGIKRYGRSLQTFNGRNAVRDLQDELADAQAYAEQVAMEQEAKDEALVVLARFVRSRERVGGHGGAPASVRAALVVAEKLEATRAGSGGGV